MRARDLASSALGPGLLFGLAAALLASCDDKPSSPPPSAAAAASARPTAPSTTPVVSATAKKAAALELQRFTLTSGVDKREPVDAIDSAEPGQRVYAHAALRNRTGEARRVSLVFNVGGEERSTVDLRVEPSWSFRTWGYVTLRPGDRAGKLVVELHDEHGEILADKTIPIRPTTAPVK